MLAVTEKDCNVVTAKHTMYIGWCRRRGRRMPFDLAFFTRDRLKLKLRSMRENEQSSRTMRQERKTMLRYQPVFLKRRPLCNFVVKGHDRRFNAATP